MKILIIGGNGTIGKKVTERVSVKHEVIVAGRNSGDVNVDFSESKSIKSMFETIGKLDAIVAIAGDAKWDKFNNLSEEDFYIGIKSKLMGQVNVVRIGKEFLNHNGSITLSTGILADDPVDMTTSAAMVNGGIHSFVKAVALELENGIRINAVSSDLVEDAYEKYKDYFPGNTPVSMDKIVDGYVKSIEGKITGRILRILA
ncbi:short chain dehydrogenase [Lacinutrix venerupis]|uniref:Short chain dehydrogenase n=1 Tax=Lacinutrix venerupis TaxID=1486034 RepID=A0AAC9LL75_9FLAO|nr:short chain dehydrogenase [Lacinutrix venerupis]APX99426.1 short chain dehydrogenase [Lacinutrix venerupis]